jgi:hypothetical protein
VFQESADNVEKRLREMVLSAEALLSDKTDEVFTLMRRDYRSIVGGGDVPQHGEMLPRDQRLVRREVMTVIKGVEKAFMKVAGSNVNDEEEEEDDEIKKDEPESSSGVKEEQDNVKRESSPSNQLAMDEQPPQSPVSGARRAASANAETADTKSETESETESHSLEDPMDTKHESDSDASEGGSDSSDSE